MYPRKNHFLFYGFSGLFFLICLLVSGWLVFCLGLSQGVLAAGGEMSVVGTAPAVFTVNNLLIIFGGILLLMVVRFVFRLVYWKWIGKQEMAFFAAHKGKFVPPWYGRRFRYSHWHHYPGCWDWEDEDNSEKPFSKEKNGEE